MNSLSAVARRIALAVLCVVVLPAALVPVALAAPTPKTGEYLSAQGRRSIAFSLAKQHGEYQVENFTIQCFVNDSSFGAILFNGPARVRGNDSFSYTGPAGHLANGTLAGHATIRLSGTFMSSSTVTGTAGFSHAKQSGCPATAFTATLSK